MERKTLKNMKFKKEVIISYKGFSNKWECQGFKFKVGETFHHDGPVVQVCKHGFHACEYPLDVFKYYPPAGNRFAKVKQSGDISHHHDDTKVASSILTIDMEIDQPRLAAWAMDWVISKLDRSIQQTIIISDPSSTMNTDFRSVAINTGNLSEASNTGDWSVAVNTGHQSTAMNTGACSTASNSGDRSVAINIGDYSAAINTGDSSVAKNEGSQSAATNTGYYSAAINTGYLSVATNIGYFSIASNTGDYSSATNTGYQSVAMNTGYQSVATSTGNLSEAINSGNWSAATSTGDRSVAMNMGDYSAAINTGDYSTAEVLGSESVAAALGVKGRVRASAESAIVLCYRDKNGCLIHIRTSKVGENGIKEGVWYSLDADGEFIEVKDPDDVN